MPGVTIASLPEVKALIRVALEEDVGSGDATSLALVATDARVRADMIARHACVVAGTDVAAAVFNDVDPALEADVRIADGASAGAGDVVMCIRGPAQGMLTAERTALNFIQRLTGIATLTRRFVLAVEGTGVEILDTRKTTPGYRALEKYAVRCGGGTNHRMGLYDRVMIKDNHRQLWGGGDPLSLDAAVREARKRFPKLAVEVEVESEVELKVAMQESPEWILLDNMPPDRLRRCVEICAGASKLEASGGITLANVATVAASGVDAISLGCLTHSAPAADLSLEIAKEV